MEEKKRRRPGVEKKIAEIDENDYRVRVTGVVVDKNGSDLLAMIDDGSGRIKALFSRKEDFEQAEEEKLVRVIGKVIKEEELALDVEIIQDMQDLDTELYDKVKEIEKKGG